MSSDLFQGDLMSCDLCKREQRSDPTVESGWYQLVIDTVPRYFCPRCFGSPQTPECSRCQRFYHEDYDSCPWCTGVPS